MYTHIAPLKVVLADRRGLCLLRYAPSKKTRRVNALFIFVCVALCFSKRKSRNKSRDNLIEPLNESD